MLNKAIIKGTGSYVPNNIITNEELEVRVDTNSKWIFENLGIKERRILDDNQSTSDLGFYAGLNAIHDAFLTPSDIDMIIVATATPDRKEPSTASIIQNKLSATNAIAFDINAVCSGFLFAQNIACQYIYSGQYNNILVIGADSFSRITNWSRRDSVFFGDGAGAVVISRNNNVEGFLSHRLYTDTNNDMYGFTIPGGGTEIPLNSHNLNEQYFLMNGKSVFNMAVKSLPIAINSVLNDASLNINDIDYMIPHQPSIRILKETANIIGLPFKKVMTNMDKYANTSSATIPLLLDEVNKSGKLKNNNLILFVAIGSGWTYGASILKWHKI